MNGDVKPPAEENHSVVKVILLLLAQTVLIISFVAFSYNIRTISAVMVGVGGVCTVGFSVWNWKLSMAEEERRKAQEEKITASYQKYLNLFLNSERKVISGKGEKLQHPTLNLVSRPHSVHKLVVALTGSGYSIVTGMLQQQTFVTNNRGYCSRLLRSHCVVFCMFTV